MKTVQKINYDLWANNLICEAITSIRNDEITKQEAIRQFSHLFKAQVIWFNRIHGINDKIDVWGDYTEDTCSSLLNDCHSMLEGIAAKIGEEIEYQDSKGNSFKNSVEDIFDHVIIHGQHHRAQISMLLRKAGFTPPATDYIYFLRSL